MAPLSDAPSSLVHEFNHGASPRAFTASITGCGTGRGDRAGADEGRGGEEKEKEGVFVVLRCSQEGYRR